MTVSQSQSQSQCALHALQHTWLVRRAAVSIKGGVPELLGRCLPIDVFQFTTTKVVLTALRPTVVTEVTQNNLMHRRYPETAALTRRKEGRQLNVTENRQHKQQYLLVTVAPLFKNVATLKAPCR